MPTKNVPMLSKVRDTILTEPWNWDQEHWFNTTNPDAEVAIVAEQVRLAERRGLDHIISYGVKVPLARARQVSRADFCDTTCCVAGFAALYAGATPVGEEDDEGVTLVDTPDGRRMPVNTYAMEVLGLSSGEAGSLFYGGNTAAGVLGRLNQHIEEGEAEERAEADALAV